MKVKKSVVFAAALACGILLAVPLGAAAASSYRMAENGPATREESARLNRTFLYLNIEYNDRAPHEHLDILARLSASLEDDDLLQRLLSTHDPKVIYNALK